MFSNKIKIAASAVRLHDEFEFAGRKAVITHIVPQRGDVVTLWFRPVNSAQVYQQLRLDNDYVLTVTRK